MSLQYIYVCLFAAREMPETKWMLPTILHLLVNQANVNWYVPGQWLTMRFEAVQHGRKEYFMADIVWESSWFPYILQNFLRYYILIWLNITTFITKSKNHRIKNLISLDLSNTKNNFYRISIFTNILTTNVL